jgi:phospholipid/cholesterol/gamma-HCH transport system substrate-binding protein
MRAPKRFSERSPVVIGVIGTAIVVLSLLLALGAIGLPFGGSGRGYSALFTESGGLESGDEVVVAGLPVGSVDGVHLDNGHVRVDFSLSDDAVHLGKRTRASITTLTLLGKRGLQLDSAGAGSLADGTTIPLRRTTAPYDLTDALSGLTHTTGAIDTAEFAKALRTISSAFQDTPASVRQAVRGVGRISRTIASRESQIHSLLAASNNVSGILAARNTQITRLLDDGTTLLTVLNERRDAIASLLRSVGPLARELEGLVADNKHTLRPALTELTSVVRLLNRNKRNIQIVLDRAGPFAGSLGESVSSGPFFQAYVQNLSRPVDLVGLDTSPLCVLLGCKK